MAGFGITSVVCYASQSWPLSLNVAAVAAGGSSDGTWPQLLTVVGAFWLLMAVFLGAVIMSYARRQTATAAAEASGSPPAPVKNPFDEIPPR